MNLNSFSESRSVLYDQLANMKDTWIESPPLIEQKHAKAIVKHLQSYNADLKNKKLKMNLKKEDFLFLYLKCVSRLWDNDHNVGLLISNNIFDELMKVCL